MSVVTIFAKEVIAHFQGRRQRIVVIVFAKAVTMDRVRFELTRPPYCPVNEHSRPFAYVTIQPWSLATIHSGYDTCRGCKKEEDIEGENQVSCILGKRAAGKGLQAFVEPLVDGRDCRGREGVAAKLPPDRLNLPRRDALHIHLRQARHQRPFRALVALETARWRSSRSCGTLSSTLPTRVISVRP